MLRACVRWLSAFCLPGGIDRRARSWSCNGTLKGRGGELAAPHGRDGAGVFCSAGVLHGDRAGPALPVERPGPLLGRRHLERRPGCGHIFHGERTRKMAQMCGPTRKMAQMFGLDNEAGQSCRVTAPEDRGATMLHKQSAVGLAVGRRLQRGTELATLQVCNRVRIETGSLTGWEGPAQSWLAVSLSLQLTCSCGAGRDGKWGSCCTSVWIST